MNAINSFVPLSHDPQSEIHSDAKTELVRHLVDLRIHAGVMSVNAVLAVYICYSVCDGAAADFLSASALAIFLTLAVLSCLEAHRCWRKAAMIAGSAKKNATAKKRAAKTPSKRAPGSPGNPAGGFSPLPPLKGC